MPVPFIFYHKIASPPPDARIRGGYTPPERFAAQMAYLKKRGFVFYTASELVEHFRAFGKYPARGIAVTFDDGWKDNYESAFPVLKRLGIKATIFMIPSCVGRVSTKALSEGESGREHLSREEILEMDGHGVEFGSHTLNHRLLHQISPDEVRFELEESKRQIEGLLGKPCKVLAYPGGHYDETARRLAEGAGYTAAFTSHYGPDEPPDFYALNRTEILRRDRFLFQFARKVKPLLRHDA